MNRYKNILAEYHSGLKEFHTLIIQLTMNIKQDYGGLFTDRTQFSERLYELSSSIQYRLLSVDWHLQNLCREHAYSENKLKNHGIGKIDPRQHYLYFIFDDFIFNLISLYDYFGSYCYLAFIDHNEHKKMWSNLANAAGSQNNSFSYCILGKEVFKHHRNWAKKLIDFRAEIIHYKLKTGGEKRKISITKVGETYHAKYQLMYSIPDDLVKLLKLENCKKNEVGIDLQFGAIEIGKKSILSFNKLTKIALTHCTKNKMRFS